MTTRTIGPFLGPYRSLDYRYIPENAASQTLNARHSDGALLTRYGFRNVANAQSGHTANYGCVYLQGYDSSYALVEEYITFENLGVSTRAYYRNASSGVATQVSATTRASSPWTGFSFDQYGYFINPDESTPVFRRVIGSASSFVAIAQPDPPAASPTVEVLYQTSSGQGYSQQTFTGTTVATHITYTGRATSANSAVNSDGSLTIGHSGGLPVATGAASFEVDMKAGVGGGSTNLDWQYNDIFAFSLRSGSNSFEIDPDSIVVTFTNDDGSPLSFTPQIVQSEETQQDPQNIVVRIQFDNKVRANWDNIRKIKVAYNVTSASSTASSNTLTISKIFVGCCWISPDAERLPGQYLNFAYAYEYSGAGLVSTLSPFKPIWTPTLRGPFPIAGVDFDGLGCWLKFTFVTSGDSNVDNNKLYVQDGTQLRLIVSQSDASTTYTLKMSYTEIIELDDFKVAPFQYLRCVNAFTFKGRVVWLYNQGQQNVKHSRVGEPEKHAADHDELDDDNRGATFSLADNFADVPLGGSEIGDACVIFGSNGVYTQTGDGGPFCTPPKRLAHTFGCANKFAFSRWATDSGQVGAVFATRNAEGVYMVVMNDGQGAENSFKVIELTQDVRGLIKDFLIDGQSLTLTDYQTNVRVGVDPEQNRLWVILNERAIVFTKAINDTRYWEMYEYDANNTYFRYLAFSPRRRMRVLMSDGDFAELEFNSNTNTFITGANRDAGNAVPTPYWESKTFEGKNRRTVDVGLQRYDMSETPSVTIYSQSDPTGNTYTVAANKKYVKAWIDDQGEWLRYRVSWAENTDAIQMLTIHESPLGNRRHR